MKRFEIILKKTKRNNKVIVIKTVCRLGQKISTEGKEKRIKSNKMRDKNLNYD